MKYINTFKTHASYEEKLNVGGVDFKIPNVSYCKDVKDVHFNPYNLIKFYVGEITPPQTVKIYTDETTSVPIQVSEGNKWYTYLLPKDKGLYKIEGDSVKKIVVKADINGGIYFIPKTTIEASFKGSDTSNVTIMGSMFRDCGGLTSLDLSGWDTSKVTNMSGMFNGCSGLTSLYVSNFDTSNVTYMNTMFSNCRSLTSLDLSGWNTSKVTDIGGMFVSCYSLTSLDLRNFDTSNVTNMDGMLDGCSGLTSLDLSGWDTSKANSISYMFRGCDKLKTIRMVGCSQDTIKKITDVKPSGATIVTK